MKQALVQCSQCTVDEGLKTVDQPTRGKKEGKGKKKKELKQQTKIPRIQDQRPSTLSKKEKKQDKKAGETLTFMPWIVDDGS